MKRLTPLLIAVATLAGVVAFTARAPRHAAAQEAAPIFVTEIPSAYRDWRLISVAHEEGDLHSFAAVLGNDVAIKAYREGKLLFPDGTIIAALHYRHKALPMIEVYPLTNEKVVRFHGDCYTLWNEERRVLA